MTNSVSIRRNFFYTDARGVEISPNGFKHPVQLDATAADPGLGGRIVETVAYETMTLFFKLISGSGSLNTLWGLRASVEGQNWTNVIPSLNGIGSDPFMRSMRFAHPFTFPVSRFIAVDIYVATWGDTDSVIDAYVTLA